MNARKTEEERTEHYDSLVIKENSFEVYPSITVLANRYPKFSI